MTSSDGAADPLAGGREAAPERYLTPAAQAVQRLAVANDELAALRSRVAALEEAIRGFAYWQSGRAAFVMIGRARAEKIAKAAAALSSGPPEAGTPTEGGTTT